jgi:methyl-accepting chemotaxis protein
MIRDLSISTKLLMVFILSYLFIVGLLGWIVVNRFQQALQTYTFTSLSALREVKKTQVEYYFTRLRVETITVVQSPITRVAAGQLMTAYSSLKDELKVTDQQMAKYKEAVGQFYEKEFIKKLNAHVIEDHKASEYMPVDPTSIILQYLYIVSNPNPAGSKSFLNMANDGSVYSLLHGKFQDLLKDIIKRFSFHDMYIVNPQTGDIVYSVYKDVDFATNLKTGPYRDTNLAKVFNDCVESNNKDFVRLADFKEYDPAYGTAVAFIGAPVYDGDKKTAVVIFQLRIDDINNFMTENDHWDKLGLGKTGEAYLVGDAHKMRSVSRLFAEDPGRYLHILEAQDESKKIIDQMRVNKTTILLQEVNTIPVKDFMRGQVGTQVDTNYLGKTVLSSYAPLSIQDLTWGIVVEMQRDEVLAPLSKLLKRGGIVMLLLLLLLLSIIYSCLSYLLKPLHVFIKRLQSISTDPTINLGQHITTMREDEMGYLAIALNNALYRLQHLITSVQEEYSLLNAALNAHTISDDQIDRSLKVFTKNMSGMEQKSEDLIYEVRQMYRKHNQCYEIIYGIKNTIGVCTGALSTLTVGVKKINEVVAQTKNQRPDIVLDGSLLSVEQATNNLSQQIVLLNQQVADAQKVMGELSQASPEETTSKLHTYMKDAQQVSQELNSNIKKIATIAEQIKKVNEDLGKILATFGM